MFFDAFHKTGVTPQRLATALNDLKGNGFTGFKDELVSDEFIDKDIQLMYATYHAFKNPHIEEYIKNRGFEKYGKEHRTLVQ
jgi:isochorismate hydrolase